MKLRQIGKKADLSLSINAIVVLILAITMLGLGLGFMRGTFSKTTAQFSEVSETVKEQIIEDIKASNDKLAFNKLEITMKKGETRDLFFGIRNVEDGKLSFNISRYCDKSLSGDEYTIPTSGNVCTGTACGPIALNTFNTEEVEQGEVSVLKLQVVADTEASLDTYSCRLVVQKKGSADSDWQSYAERKFFVVVN